MSIEDYRDSTKRYRTLHRDDMYHPIRDNDQTGMFKQINSIFLMSFAIGFHRRMLESVKGGNSDNHVNNLSIDSEIQDVIILMILDRHTEITSPEQKDQLWSLVEQYAEGGIKVLYESLRLSEWVLDVDSVIGN